MERKAAHGAALTTADLVVLSLISEKPMHGYALVKEYERQEVEDWASVSRPHVYYALRKLAERGLIDIDPDGGQPEPRGKSVYLITAAGSEALSDALASTVWAQTRTPTAFNTWLGLSMHARPADGLRMLSARKAYLLEQIGKETRTLTDISADTGGRARAAAVMVGMCIETFEVELRWLDRLEAILRHP